MRGRQASRNVEHDRQSLSEGDAGPVRHDVSTPTAAGKDIAGSDERWANGRGAELDMAQDGVPTRAHL